MLERIDRLVFYFTIDCSICHNLMKVSHVAVEETNGVMSCSLCNKQIKVPDHAKLIQSAKELNDYLSNKLNQKFIKVVLNEAFIVEDDAVPAH